MPDPETRELQVVQRKREEHERERVAESTTEHEALVHDRRAARAAYLEEKLAERARSEDEQERA